VEDEPEIVKSQRRPLVEVHPEAGRRSLSKERTMGDLFIGIVFLVTGYLLEASFLNGDPAKFMYAFDVIGGLMCVSGLYKMIRGTKMDDR
jgi:hypothetical protein